jgi:hypothetical protein
MTAVFALSLSTASQLCYSQTPPILSWQLLDERITLHEPVMLSLSIYNQGSDVAMLDFGSNFTQGLLVTVITPGGTVVRTPPLEPPEGTSSIGRVALEPGARYVREFVMDEWYDFDLPGKYGIGVSLRFPITVGKSRVLPPGETFGAITIDARNETALRKRLDDLMARATDTDSGDVSMEVARILNRISDPMVIPYLIRLSHLPLAQHIAIRALGKFSTAQAIDALISIAAGNGLDASWTKVTLLQIAQRVQDPKLQERIYEALSEPRPR